MLLKVAELTQVQIFLVLKIKQLASITPWSLQARVVSNPHKKIKVFFSLSFKSNNKQISEYYARLLISLWKLFSRYPNEPHPWHSSPCVVPSSMNQGWPLTHYNHQNTEYSAQNHFQRARLDPKQGNSNTCPAVNYTVLPASPHFSEEDVYCGYLSLVPIGCEVRVEGRSYFSLVLGHQLKRKLTQGAAVSSAPGPDVHDEILGLKAEPDATAWWDFADIKKGNECILHVEEWGAGDLWTYELPGLLFQIVLNFNHCLQLCDSPAFQWVSV